MKTTAQLQLQALLYPKRIRLRINDALGLGLGFRVNLLWFTGFYPKPKLLSPGARTVVTCHFRHFGTQIDM